MTLRWNKLAPYVFISPFFILFAVFAAWPIALSIQMSLFDSIGFKTKVFVGLENYAELFRDRLFWKAIFNTLYFAAGTFLIQIPFALGLALLLNSKWLKARTFFRLAFFSPVLIAGVFIALIFNLIYNQSHGMLNYLLSTPIPRHLLSTDFSKWLFQRLGIGSPPFGWLREEHLVMPAIIMAGVWRWSGFNMVYFLAGLQAIREELYEAAAIDGATRLQSFLHVTLPGLRPIILFVFIMSMIGSFELFDIPYVLLGGPGPNDAGLTVVMYLYRMGFSSLRLGYAAAIGWILFAIVFLVSAVQFRLLRARE